MLIWYLATAVVAVWAVFDSPALDYRFVMAGAVLPVVEIGLGRPGPLHSLVVVSAVLGVVMAATVGRRLLRRRLLGVPIGLYAHLVFSGAWADTEAFWWPLTGTALSTSRPPELARGVWTVVAEILGLALAWWWTRRVGLWDPASGRAFLASGRLPRGGSDPRLVRGSC